MSFRKLAVLGAALAGVFAFGAANAADLGAKVHYKAPAPAQYVSWTGPYVGLAVGYHSGKITQAGCVGFCPNGATVKGAFLMSQFGYDYQLANNIVIGAFGAIPLTRIKPTDVSIGLPGFTFRTTPKFVANFNARIGYAYQNFLPYVFGGIVFAKTTVNNPFTFVDFNKTYTGYALGAGVEYAINRNWSLDAKYSYIHLPKESYAFGGPVQQYGEDSHNIMMGVNYRFR